MQVLRFERQMRLIKLSTYIVGQIKCPVQLIVVFRLGKYGSQGLACKHIRETRKCGYHLYTNISKSPPAQNRRAMFQHARIIKSLRDALKPPYNGLQVT